MTLLVVSPVRSPAGVAVSFQEDAKPPAPSPEKVSCAALLAGLQGIFFRLSFTQRFTDCEEEHVQNSLREKRNREICCEKHLIVAKIWCVVPHRDLALVYIT